MCCLLINYGNTKEKEKNMDGNGITLKTLLQSNALEVPFFQRPYVWEEEHFEALIDSLEDSPEATMPFFGSVILKEFDNSCT